LGQGHGIGAIHIQTTLNKEELFTVITRKMEMEKTQGTELVNIFLRQLTEFEFDIQLLRENY
jgi:hypothetical protein